MANSKKAPTMLDSVMSFFGIPAATKHDEAIDVTTTAIASSNEVISEAHQLCDAVKQLETMFEPR